MPTSLPSRSLLVRRLLIGAAIVLAVVVTGFLALAVTDSDGSDDSAAPRTDATSENGESGDGGSADASDSGTDDPIGTARPGDDPNGGVEVLPPSPSQSGLPGLEPPDLSPLVSRPLPAAASARDRLVKGYPRTAIPLAPTSTVTTSSVSPSDGRRLRVALTADTDRSPGQILLFYRLHFAKLGFVENAVSTMGDATGAAFTRGQNSATIVVSEASYALSAVLIAGA